ISRAGTGSCRAMTRRTSATPAGPSASPTAAATSAATASASMRRVLGHARFCACCVQCFPWAIGYTPPSCKESSSRPRPPARPQPPPPPPCPPPRPPPRPAVLPPVPKQLWTVDASLTPGSPVSDIGELSAAAADAVRAGGGTVLDSSHVIFPNGAVTLVLI